MKISGRHVETGAHVIVDGRRTQGSVASPDSDHVVIHLTSLPDPGIHLLQVQNPGGQFSNDFIFHVVESSDAADELVALRARDDCDIRDAIAEAIAKDDVDELRGHLNRRQQQARVNEQQPRSGATPLSNAAMHGRLEIAEVLIRHGANVNGTNRDGNTPLRVAAFFCREDLVKMLLEKGASVTKKSNRGETPIDVVFGTWDDELAGIYKYIDDAVGLDLDLDRIQRDRPKIAMLMKAGQSEDQSDE